MSVNIQNITKTVNRGNNTVKLELKYNPNWVRNMNETFNDYGALQQFADYNFIKRIEPFMPRLDGIMYDSQFINTQIGSGVVIVGTPYVNYQYNGKRQDGSHKVNKYSNQTGKRGSDWVNRFKLDSSFKEYVNELQQFVNRSV